MKKYVVLLTEDVTRSASILVEANDEQEAYETAVGIASSGEANFELNDGYSNSDYYLGDEKEDITEATPEEIKSLQQEDLNREYVQKHGQYCPVCGCGNQFEWNQLEWGEIDASNSRVTQIVCCNQCRSQWIDEYKLTRFFDLKAGRAQV